MTTVIAAPEAPEALAPAPQSGTPPTAAPSAPAGGTPAAAPEGKAPEAPTGETPAKPDDEAERQRRHRRQLNTAYRKEAEARARADLLEKQLNEFRASQTQPAQDPAAPKLEQFKDIEEYAAAKAKYESDRTLREFQAKQQGETQKQQVARIAESWESKVEAASEKYDDWDETVGNNIRPTTPALTAIMEADNGPDIAYFLVKNPKEAARLDKLPVLAQILEIGRISAKLASEPKKPATPSKAPAPITPVTGTAPATNTDWLTNPNTPDKEWMERRRKQLAARRRN